MTTKKPIRLCSFFLLFCLLTLSLCNSNSLFTAHAAVSDEKTIYVAFGDSIAAGYGLNGYTKGQTTAPADSYQAILSRFLKTTSVNYAVTGDNSTDCMELLNSGKADESLKNADIITLSIGSNDLLLPFIQIVMDHFNIQPGTIDASAFDNGFTMPDINAAEINISDLLKYYQQSEALIAKLTDNETLHAQANAFPEKLEAILSVLHEKAPSAEIYVTNIYNPFAFIPMLSSLADSYIREINQAFSANAPDYTLIDVYTPFNKEALTNVHFDLKDPSSINPDPHPSVQGHKKIADLLTTALKQAHNPDVASFRSLKSSGKTKITAKIDLPANADSYQIRYASSKNGTYQTLAASSEKTYQTNTKKLKSGKTYYFRVRSFKTIKGVTYYGKNSSTKKITIK